MKQIIPFTKTIDLSTNVEEITSISLDKIINSNRDNEITGDFELYLEYKENDISIDTESYTATIPFNISLDDRYDSKDSKVEIDDFYYEIEDSRVILHVDVLVDGLNVAEKELENVIPIRKEEVSEDEKIEEVKSEIKLEEDREDREDEIEGALMDKRDEIEDLFKEVDEEIKPVEVKEKKSKPIFETFDPNNETYVTYNVHIVRNDDNVDSICAKYNVTKEELAYYNELKEIKMGDKLIVPTYKK